MIRAGVIDKFIHPGADRRDDMKDDQPRLHVRGQRTGELKGNLCRIGKIRGMKNGLDGFHGFLPTSSQPVLRWPWQSWPTDSAGASHLQFRPLLRSILPNSGADKGKLRY